LPQRESDASNLIECAENYGGDGHRSARARKLPAVSRRLVGLIERRCRDRSARLLATVEPFAPSQLSIGPALSNNNAG
jgi:hypothetical protein